ncbi:hypothetical protein AVEN_55776-1 [Araneus ventricosus]|uniref:HTH psq-type domain-containing protein n=1 Tax=Araneus ventricosus TaxID=182803 RepID=A0A4Y2EYZ2_ARAVE|nr:hypothetical protein AVEN_55776-1 [Araneus ventricosus]
MGSVRNCDTLDLIILNLAQARNSVLEHTPETQSSSVNPSVRKRTAFSIEDKVKIIQRIKNGERQSDVCREFSLSKFTVWTIWKNRAKISAYEKNLIDAEKLRNVSAVNFTL